ncbi:MAG: hypothetical protein Ct9H300mP12_05340 [Acidimicrobiales bacterium]|nr:MAG: hypothetical protein Ct9H300mP12_05340 [Acidimicrobiales bacterium]
MGHIGPQHLPGWFADDERGFADSSSRGGWWARHVDRTAEALEDLVAGWVPIEDPIGLGPPGATSWESGPRSDRPRGRPGGRGGLIGGDLRSLAPPAQRQGPGHGRVFRSLGLRCRLPERSRWEPGRASSPEAGPRPGCKLGTRAWDPWLRALADGELAWPWRGPVDRPELAGAFDLVGLAADHPVAVDASGAAGPYPPDARIDASNCAPLPEELGVALRRVHDRLGDQDLMVAGWGVSTTDDDWRDELLHDVVAQVESAVADGLPVVGLFHDGLLDGYTTAGWGSIPGFSGPRGLVTRDRRLKESGRWLSERITGRPPAGSLS